MTSEDNIRDVSIGGPGATEPPPSSPPPLGPRLRVVLPVAILLVLALAAGILWGDSLRSAAKRLYDAVRGPVEETAEKTQYYTCGMHPWVVLPKPGNCPICHMKLVPLDPAKFTSEIAINPVMTQNIGVRIAPVTTGPVKRVVRTVGTVDYNEKNVRDVNLKVAGWVEKLYVNTTGQIVEKDQPLLEIYSPDLFSAQVEYLVALRKKESQKSATGLRPGEAGPVTAEASAADEALLESSRKRLEFLDISPEQIRDLEKACQASKTMTLRSPFRGIVVAKNVFEGQKVEAGMQLLRIADLAQVWIMATIYESQIPFVEVGQKAVMSLPYIPGRTFDGKVAYIYPYLNAELRQAKVRLEFENPSLLLKPGMFADVRLERTLATDRTLVPREAVIDTGERQIAFVSLGEGRFEPRNVKVGVEAEDGMIEVLDGLRPGEMIVVSGEFLLDSEARLREDLAKMVKGDLATEQKPGATAAPPKPTGMPGMPGM